MGSTPFSRTDSRCLGLQEHRAYCRGLQLFREVFAVNPTILGVTSLQPQVGHATFAVARSAKVSTTSTSKFFVQLSHPNSYLGMSSTLVANSPRVPREERLDRALLRKLSAPPHNDSSYSGQK